MQVKAADDKPPTIDALTALLGRPDVDGHTRRRIEAEAFYNPRRRHSALDYLSPATLRGT